MERLCRSLAMLEAILSPEWEFRYYSFNQHWNPGQRMASMRNGCGDDWFMVFRDGLVFLKAFDHEMPRPKQSPTRRVPPEFAAELAEPAFSMEDVTFCAWWTDKQWNSDGNPGDFFKLFDGRPESYLEWASDYYEVELTLAPVQAIYEQQPLSAELLVQLNPDVTLDDLQTDLEEIGYP